MSSNKVEQPPTESDSAKPTVIDATTFVSENYTAKIAAGECEVAYYYFDYPSMSHGEDREVYSVEYVKNDECLIYGKFRTIETFDDCKLEVKWLPTASAAVAPKDGE